MLPAKFAHKKRDFKCFVKQKSIIETAWCNLSITCITVERRLTNKTNSFDLKRLSLQLFFCKFLEKFDFFNDQSFQTWRKLDGIKEAWKRLFEIFAKNLNLLSRALVPNPSSANLNFALMFVNFYFENKWHCTFQRSANSW